MQESLDLEIRRKKAFEGKVALTQSLEKIKKELAEQYNEEVKICDNEKLSKWESKGKRGVIRGRK